MKSTRTFIFVIACVMTVFCSQLFADENDYSAGIDVGWSDMEGDSRAGTYWDAFLANPSQSTWDFYLGYVDGYSGQSPNYTGEPFPIEYLNSCVGEQTTSYLLTQVGTDRLARTYRSLMRKSRRRQVKAAGALNDLSLSFDYSFASVDDDILDGSGHDSSGTIMANTMVGDDLMLALGFTRNVYEINAADWDQTTDSFDFLVSYQLFTKLNVGAFLSFSRSDIEDQKINGVTVEGTSLDRWGGGLLAYTDMDLGANANLGLTATLASMNKDTIGDLGDDEDTAGILLLDVGIFATDYLTITPFVSYLTLLDREGGPDGSYYAYGVDLEWKASQSSYLKIGYETTASDNDHQENRLNLGVTFRF